MTQLLSLSAVLCLVSLSWPLCRLWLAVRRTALYAAWWWTAAAALVWTATTVLGALEPEPGDWIGLGHLRLLASTLALGPLVSVLGARWPGTRAWNLIVLSLLVVFSLPLVEQWLLGRLLERGRVGMDLPRFVFYWVVAAVGVVNYVPTRFGLAALAFAAALAVQTIAMGPWTISAPSVATLGDVAGVLASGAAWVALGLRRRIVPTGIDGAWLTLRDGWGLVWALRVRDRWNAAAEHYAWPTRLTWSGFQPVVGAATTSEQFGAAAQQFRLLLRRFADPDKLMNPAKGENATPNDVRRCGP